MQILLMFNWTKSIPCYSYSHLTVHMGQPPAIELVYQKKEIEVNRVLVLSRDPMFELSYYLFLYLFIWDFGFGLSQLSFGFDSTFV